MKSKRVLKDPRYLQKNHPWKEGGPSMESVKTAARRMFKPINKNAK